MLKQGTTMSGVDEDDLDEELAELQQEELDNKMLKTGSVPISDEVNRLPIVAHGERKFDIYTYTLSVDHFHRCTCILILKANSSFIYV